MPASARILIAEPMDFSPAAVQLLRQIGQVDLKDTDSQGLRQALEEYDIFWFRLANRIDAELLKPPLRCRILATPVTGLDHICLKTCAEQGIQVVSLRGEVEFLKTVRATAELTIALTYAVLRHVPRAVESVQQGVWNRDLFRGREVFGKTVGLVGLGRLGTIVAEYFSVMGARVIGYDPRPDFPHHVCRQCDSLLDMLAASDIVSVHAKYDETTRHLLGPRQFAAMKPGAVLINTARGGIVDETALLAALDSGQVSAAGLDVLDGEPKITGEHPVVKYAQTHDNLLITPHIGGNTSESFAKTEMFLARRILEIWHAVQEDTAGRSARSA